MLRRGGCCHLSGGTGKLLPTCGTWSEIANLARRYFDTNRRCRARKVALRNSKTPDIRFQSYKMSRRSLRREYRRRNRFAKRLEDGSTSDFNPPMVISERPSGRSSVVARCGFHFTQNVHVQTRALLLSRLNVQPTGVKIFVRDKSCRGNSYSF